MELMEDRISSRMECMIGLAKAANEYKNDRAVRSLLIEAMNFTMWSVCPYRQKAAEDYYKSTLPIEKKEDNVIHVNFRGNNDDDSPSSD